MRTSPSTEMISRTVNDSIVTQLAMDRLFVDHALHREQALRTFLAPGPTSSNPALSIGVQGEANSSSLGKIHQAEHAAATLQQLREEQRRESNLLAIMGYLPSGDNSHFRDRTSSS
jgi:hypothetical protein